jgi:hypothetical protein
VSIAMMLSYNINDNMIKVVIHDLSGPIYISYYMGGEFYKIVHKQKIMFEKIEVEQDMRQVLI